ncbi:YjiH family protein [Brachybacterium saurashtrense]|uniref:YjiH family protein n=1 Tax=Brachybacterium saurashtrense TaxID=556288 RepID=A0A345YRB0_9MICO|nr:YjiH family protein [Brachybacterium saurashtrense]AXK46462.1 YjiH family protein [Brachybacterium saurashtrense]RRR24203.1 YjiH family protein [Brachybacterium saurashtrense]
MMTTSDAAHDPGLGGTAARRNTSGIALRPMPGHRWRFFVYSAIGLAMFFVSVEIGGRSTILVDHALTLVRWLLGPAVPWVVVALVLLGTVRPFVTGSWRRGALRTVFSLLNVVGLAVAVCAAAGYYPGPLANPDIGPFLWEKLGIPVGLIVPIGAVFLALLINYGLMEFIGVLVRPIMRPVWKVPGRAAVDAVASFVGSYSLALLITDRVYREGRYTGKEAAIIATGFSTVSATFMVIVASTLDLMAHWTLYFVLTLVVTFAVTAITVRIPPLSRVPAETFGNVTHTPEPTPRGNRLALAWEEAMRALANAPGLLRGTWGTFKDGVLMSAAIVPSILSVGLAGLLLATYTPVFDLLGWLFVPFAFLVQLPDPVLAGKAFAVGIAEMFLPATVVAGHESEVLRFTVGVTAVSQIVFFSALVPSILATRIPVNVGHLVVVWFLRVVLTILIAAPLAHLLL